MLSRMADEADSQDHHTAQHGQVEAVFEVDKAVHVESDVHVEVVVHPPIPHEPAQRDEKSFVKPGGAERQALDRRPSEYCESHSETEGKGFHGSEHDVKRQEVRGWLGDAASHGPEFWTCHEGARSLPPSKVIWVPLPLVPFVEFAGSPALTCNNHRRSNVYS